MEEPATAAIGAETDRSALILAGGASRRIGEPKPFLEIGGRTLLERLLAATRALGDVVLAVDDPVPFTAALERLGWEPVASSRRDASPGGGGDPVSGAAIDFRSGRRTASIVPDPEPRHGPLAGLASGLAAIGTGSCWVVSCDLPFVTGELGAYLLDRLERGGGGTPAGGQGSGREDRAAEAAVPRIGGRWQPLCGAYRRTAGRAAADLLASGARSAHALLDAIAIEAVSRSDLESVGDPDRLLFNLNTRDDLEEARRLAGAASE